MTGGTLQSRRLLPARSSSVPEARHAIRAWLADAGRDDLADDAELAVSEVVTNALIHAGTPVELSLRVDSGWLRVEVGDGSAHLPRTHTFATASGTGRGLKLLDQTVDRWGAERRGEGKVVWFELGDAAVLTEGDRAESPAPEAAEPDVVTVVLLDVPLLLTAAWLEHAGALLREQLLMSLDDADPGGALERHASASASLALLEEQWPGLDLGLSPDELLADAVEPRVTATRLELRVPRSRVAGFEVLDTLLDQALAAADRGEMLTPPTQPEVRVMRRWLTGQVGSQAAGAAPEPMRPPGGELAPTRAPVTWNLTSVDDAPTARLAADDTNLIVAVSASAAELLGHDVRALVGRRLLAIIPERYRQAHLAGFTLHTVNGRAPLLGVPITVPVLRADGSELNAELLIEVQRLPQGRSVFVADLRAVD